VVGGWAVCRLGASAPQRCLHSQPVVYHLIPPPMGRNVGMPPVPRAGNLSADQRYTTLLRGGAVSAEGEADTQTDSSSRSQVPSPEHPAPNLQHPSGGGSRSVFSQGR